MSEMHHSILLDTELGSKDRDNRDGHEVSSIKSRTTNLLNNNHISPSYKNTTTDIKRTFINGKTTPSENLSFTQNRKPGTALLNIQKGQEQSSVLDSQPDGQSIYSSKMASQRRSDYALIQELKKNQTIIQEPDKMGSLDSQRASEMTTVRDGATARVIETGKQAGSTEVNRDPIW